MFEIVDKGLRKVRANTQQGWQNINLTLEQSLQALENKSMLRTAILSIDLDTEEKIRKYYE